VREEERESETARVRHGERVREEEKEINRRRESVKELKPQLPTNRVVLPCLNGESKVLLGQFL
jgi:hypothetical protein